MRFCCGDAFYGGHVQQLVILLARHKTPTMYYRREFPEAGGLMSYGTSIVNAYRQNGMYVRASSTGISPVIACHAVGQV